MDENFHEAMLDMDRRDDAPKVKRRGKLWTMADGQQIPIRDMTDNHLINAIRYFRRNAPSAMRKAENDGMAVASCVSGEMAEYSIESDLHELREMDPEDFIEQTVPNWGSLLKEAEKRKIASDLLWPAKGVNHA